MKQKIPDYVKIVNYSLIGMLLLWLLFGIQVLMRTPFSLSFLTLIIFLTILASCILGIWNYQKSYYKLAFWFILINIPIKIYAGLGIGIEVLPLVITIFLFDKLFKKERIISY